jgi:hypothetical protein
MLSWSAGWSSRLVLRDCSKPAFTCQLQVVAASPVDQHCDELVTRSPLARQRPAPSRVFGRHITVSYIALALVDGVPQVHVGKTQHAYVSHLDRRDGLVGGVDHYAPLPYFG